MTLEEKYKMVQKNVGVLLKANGFKKVRSQFHQELSEATCIIFIGKARGYSTSEEIKWYAEGSIFLHALGPIFRAEREPQTLDCVSGDIHLFLNRSPGELWEVTETTDVATVVSDFQGVLSPVLDGLEQQASLAAFVNRYDYEDLKGRGSQSINGLVKTAVAAKLCGMTHEYELLLEAIAKSSQGDSWFAKYHLGLVAGK